MKRSVVLGIILCFVCLNSFGQYYNIKGKVFSASSGQPLGKASVFAQNTTLGTLTDEEGEFTLSLPNGGYDLTVSYSGLETIIKRVSTADAGNVMSFVLNPKQENLDDVVIVASNKVRDGLEKYGQFFRNNFLGQTRNSLESKILNDSILQFYYYKKTNKLKVISPEPLIIENHALGYNISYALDSFVHEYDKELSIYTGNPLFSNMITEDSAQYAAWDAARNFAYQGSMLHFMRSMYDKEAGKNGFEMQTIVEMNAEEKSIPVKNIYNALHYVKDDSLALVEIYPNLPRVGILYKNAKPSTSYSANHPGEPKAFRFSVIQFMPDRRITIEENGYYHDQENILTSGYWGWEKVSDLLPYDFIPKN